MSIEIINPGLATSVQDLGRPGYFHLGIPIGGAMDRLAMRSPTWLAMMNQPRVLSLCLWGQKLDLIATVS